MNAIAVGRFLKDYGEGSIEDFQFSGRIVVPCTELKTLEWARWDQEMERLELVKSGSGQINSVLSVPCTVFLFPVMSIQMHYLGL